MRDLGGIQHLDSMPLGYLEFATIWNEGVYNGDARRLSVFFLPENADQYSYKISMVPIPVSDFSIFPDQVGLRRTDRLPQPPRMAPPPSMYPPSRPYHHPQPPVGHARRVERQHDNRQGYDRRVERRQRRAGLDVIQGPSTSLSDLSRLQFRSPQNLHRVDPDNTQSPTASTITSVGTPLGSSSPLNDGQDAAMQELPVVPEAGTTASSATE
jgi:hypothetical protein